MTNKKQLSLILTQGVVKCTTEPVPDKPKQSDYDFYNYPHHFFNDLEEWEKKIQQLKKTAVRVKESHVYYAKYLVFGKPDNLKEIERWSLIPNIFYELPQGYDLRFNPADSCKLCSGPCGNCPNETATIIPVAEAKDPIDLSRFAGDEWISVKDHGLPKEHKRYLCMVFNINCYIEEVCLFDFERQSFIYKGVNSSVTYWRELPEPPTQKKHKRL